MKQSKLFTTRDQIAPEWMAELGYRNATVVGFEHAGRLVVLLYFAHSQSARRVAAALSDLSTNLRKRRSADEWRAWCYEQCGRALVNVRHGPLGDLRDALLASKKHEPQARVAQP